jgi:hypothetical protein
MADQIYFPSLIREMLSYTFDGYDKNQFDEVMAASICLLADDDMYKVKVREQNKSGVSFPVFTRDQWGNLVFESQDD